VELLPALARRRRAEPAGAARIAQARRDVLEFWGRWFEITGVERVRQLAERVVESHPIRAADAIQIAAALVASDESPGGLEFVTLDTRQALAAEREGLRVLGPG
jgi:hypothetical protein